MPSHSIESLAEQNAELRRQIAALREASEQVIGGNKRLLMAYRLGGSRRHADAALNTLTMWEPKYEAALAATQEGGES